MSSYKKCGADVRNILNETLTQFSCYLEKRGIVGPAKGAEPRDILIDLATK